MTVKVHLATLEEVQYKEQQRKLTCLILGKKIQEKKEIYQYKPERRSNTRRDFTLTFRCYVSLPAAVSKPSPCSGPVGLEPPTQP